MSKFIAFEGPDCVGKSTQVSEVKKFLTKLGYNVEDYKIPWQKGYSYQVISKLLEEGEVVNYPLTFQAAMIENRKDFQKSILKNSCYDIIIADRWNLSSLFYGEAQGIPNEVTQILLKELREPEAYVIFDGDAFFREHQDILDKDNLLQLKIKKLYKKKTGSNIFHIEASLSVEEVTHQIISILQPFLP